MTSGECFEKECNISVKNILTGDCIKSTKLKLFKDPFKHFLNRVLY